MVGVEAGVDVERLYEKVRSRGAEKMTKRSWNLTGRSNVQIQVGRLVGWQAGTWLANKSINPTEGTEYLKALIDSTE